MKMKFNCDASVPVGVKGYLSELPIRKDLTQGLLYSEVLGEGEVRQESPAGHRFTRCNVNYAGLF